MPEQNLWTLRSGNQTRTSGQNRSATFLFSNMDELAQAGDGQPLRIETQDEKALAKAAEYAAQKGYDLESADPEQTRKIHAVQNKLAGEEIAEGQIEPSAKKRALDDPLADIAQIAEQMRKDAGKSLRPSKELLPFQEIRPPKVLAAKWKVPTVKDHGNRIVITRMGMLAVTPPQKRERQQLATSALLKARERFGEPVRVTGNKAFEILVRSYLAQFYPPYAYRATKALLTCAGEDWKASANVPVSAGWKAVYGMAEDEDEENVAQPIPNLTKGQVLPVQDADVQARQTKPPSRFTDGSLIEAMSHIHKFVEDEAAKAKLKETSGLGTEATRAAILETLLKRGFIERKGKQLVSTKAGRDLVHALPVVLTDPVTTAQWEDVLSAIADGRVTADQFEQKQKEFVTRLVDLAKKSHVQVGEARRPSGGAAGKPKKAGPVCGACGKAQTIVLKTKTGKDWLKCEKCGAAFWPSKDGKSCGTQWSVRS